MSPKVWAFLILAAPIFGANLPTPNNSFATALKLDSAGNIYIAGTYPNIPNATQHAFAAKLSPDGSQTIWWTPLAGSSTDTPEALVLGSDGSVYVAGLTLSADFPVTTGPKQLPARPQSSFAAKLNSAGAVVYATYLPGSAAAAICIDGAGHAFITGTTSTEGTFPATAGTVSAPAGNGYIIELDATGENILLAIAGFGGTEIALDAQGNIYTVGLAQAKINSTPYSTSLLVTTPGAFQPAPVLIECTVSGLGIAFPCGYPYLSKIDSTGTKLIYATFLTGTYGAGPVGLAVDSGDNVILAGTTYSPDYPTTVDAYQPEFFGVPESQFAVRTLFPPPSAGFVTKVNATGTGLIWSTLVGGSGSESGEPSNGDSITGVDIDGGGNIIILGLSASPDFPGLENTPVSARGGTGLITRLSADGSRLSETQMLSGLTSTGAVAVRMDGAADVIGSYAASGSSSATAQIFTRITLASTGRVAAIADPADNAKLVAIAPGMLLTLYGSDLAPGAPAQPANGFPTSFNGVTVTFNGIAAPILYTSATQINLQVPYEISGMTQITMAVSSQFASPPLSEFYILAVVPRQPSLFLAPGSYQMPIFDLATCNGNTFSGVQPLALNANGSLNSCSNPAGAGETVTVFMNGIGATSPAEATGAITGSLEALTPAAGTELGGSVPVFVATESVPGSISGIAQVQFLAPAPLPGAPVPSATSLLMYVGSSRVRSPGILIWVVPAK